jgi:hypothetical protein
MSSDSVIHNPLPRPLEPGEFYCWLCFTFQKLNEHEKHAKECLGRPKQ